MYALIRRVPRAALREAIMTKATLASIGSVNVSGLEVCLEPRPLPRLFLSGSGLGHRAAIKRKSAQTEHTTPGSVLVTIESYTGPPGSGIGHPGSH